MSGAKNVNICYEDITWLEEILVQFYTEYLWIYSKKNCLPMLNRVRTPEWKWKPGILRHTSFILVRLLPVLSTSEAYILQSTQWRLGVVVATVVEESQNYEKAETLK